MFDISISKRLIVFCLLFFVLSVGKSRWLLAWLSFDSIALFSIFD